jgi:hypothetical protein
VIDDVHGPDDRLEQAEDDTPEGAIRHRDEVDRGSDVRTERIYACAALA